MKRVDRGFSLVEILVVVTILGILSAVLFANFSERSAQSRDAQRRADLRELQSALELYKNEYGQYPERCTSGAAWSGQAGTNYACSDGTFEYIIGLAPEFVTTLPTDPRLNGPDSGYVYTVNGERTVYKIMAKNTVETENVNKLSPFKSCDVTDNNTGLCDAVHGPGGFNTAGTPSHCQEPNLGMGGVDIDPAKDTQFDNSYALWGGFADISPLTTNADQQVERYTEDVICDIP